MNYTKEQLLEQIKPLMFSAQKPEFIDGVGKLGVFKQEFTPAQRQTFEKKIIPAAIEKNMELLFIGTYGSDAVIRLMNTPNIPIVAGMTFVPQAGQIYHVYPNGDIGSLSSYQLYLYASKNDFTYIQNNLNLLIL